ncbi:MAG: DUF3108 domain-containing protein [Pseudomonadota bacterium]
MPADFRPGRYGTAATTTAPRPRTTRLRARWLLAAASILAAASASMAAEPVAYTAEYKLRAFGLRGKMNVEQHPEPGVIDAEGPVWRYRSELRAKGLGKLFFGGTTFEDALFEVRDGRLRPLHVTGLDTMKDRAKDVTFTWPEGDDAASEGPLAEGTDAEATFSMEMPPEVLDRALLIPAIGLDLEHSGAARDADGKLTLASAPLDPDRGYRFRVLERGQLRDYYARLVGEEALDGPEGDPVETLVFEHRRDGSSRTTTFWLAPSLDYLPIQIQQRKHDKKPHLRAVLKDYQPLDPDQQQQPNPERDAR